MKRLLLYCLMLLFPMMLLADSLNVTVMSYNIRMDTPTDGKNAWPKRLNEVMDIFRLAKPDLVGLQEVTSSQVVDLVKLMPMVEAHYGVGRDDGEHKGERCMLFWNSERFDKLDSGTFWLSKKPHNPGSKSWDAAITRICSWVKLKEKTTNKEFFFFNTHFDHKGAEARYYSILLLKKQIREMTSGLPVIVTGDFNFAPDERPYQEINATSSDYVLHDCFELAQTKIGEHTCCGFAVDAPHNQRIDHILVNNAFTVQQYEVVSTSKKGYYPSDHLPVVCKVRF